MSPEDKSDSDPGKEGSKTDPMFPPRIGAGGPAAVTVSAVQGPPSTPMRARQVSTDKLLTGLLESENDAYLYKVKSKDSAGEDALAFDVSPRALPVGHKTEDEAPVIVNERAIDTAPPGGIPVPPIRDPESTLPLGPRRSEKWVAFAVALLVVGIAGVFIVWRNGQDLPPPVGSSPPVPTVLRTIPVPTFTPADPVPPPEPAPLAVTTDAIIESQRILRNPRVLPAPLASAPAVPSVTPVKASASGKPTGPLPPDFDEIKKEIKH